MTITTPEDIRRYRISVLKVRMELELMGMRFRLNTFAQVRKEFHLTGRRQRVYTAFCKMHGLEE